MWGPAIVGFGSYHYKSECALSHLMNVALSRLSSGGKGLSRQSRTAQLVGHAALKKAILDPVKQ